MRRLTLIGAVLTVALTLGLQRAAPVSGAEHPDYSGTFTSMYFNVEGGDLLGEEIRIVYTRKGYQGTLQIAQGEPSILVLFEPTFDGNRITFTVADPFDGRPLSFEGRIDARGLRGRFRNADGTGRWAIDLKRGVGYWEGGGTQPP